MVFGKQDWRGLFAAITASVLLLICHDYGVVGVTSFMMGETRTTSAPFRAKKVATITTATSSYYNDPSVPATTPSSSSLRLSTYDSEYYSPTTEQQRPSRRGNSSSSQTRITLSRFLSEYVKDHPEVRTVALRCISLRR